MPGRRALELSFFSSQTPEGAWFGIVSDSQRFDLVHTARVVEGDDSRDR